MNNIPRKNALVKIERKQGKKLPSGVPHNIIIDSLERHEGNVDAVSQELSIAYSALHLHVEHTPELRALCIVHRESILDEAEKQLRTAVKAGNQTQVRFALRTLGRDRGYVERSEKDIRTQEIPSPKSTDLGKLSVDELKQLRSLQDKMTTDSIDM